jgi:hypothetical protein
LEVDVVRGIREAITVRVFYVLFLLLTGSIYFPQAPDKQSGSEVRIPMNAFIRWDESMNQFIAFRRTDSNPETSLEIYDATTGSKRAINILKDFPQASTASVTNVAVAPSGEILVVCRLRPASSKVLKQLILTYSSSLALEKVWDVAPYDPEAIAVDQQGNVYSLGTTYTEKSPNESYPMLVEYDSVGRIKNQFLPRSTFPSVDDPVVNSKKMGFVAIHVSDSQIFVYLPATRTMLTLDKSGKILKQFDVSKLYQQVARDKGFASFDVHEDYISAQGELWVGLMLRNPPPSTQSSPGFISLIVEVSADGQASVRHAEEGTFTTRLVGLTSSNEPMVFDVLSPTVGTPRIGIH